MKDNKTILIFGAGKIGRSFIGQLFGQSGYNVVFCDIDQDLINELNQRESYQVVIKAKTEETILVENVRAVSGLDRNAVIKEVVKASIMAVSVGKNALEKIIPAIAEGLKQRQELTPNRPLDIIIAENMRAAGEFIRSRLIELLPKNYPLNKLVGLVETSIGKMVPSMTDEDLKNDPLLIFAEPYNTLILDKLAFKGAIPKVRGFSPKKNMQAWVDRKAFIHNLGHATAAYVGNFYHPEEKYIFEVLAEKKILDLTRKTMLQAAEILVSYYPDDFTFNDLEEHTDDLLIRFQNQALKDTVFRVGQDLPRKLGIDDRFAGIIQLAQKKQLKYDRILNAMAHGFFFGRTDEQGSLNTQNQRFLQTLKDKGVKKTLTTLCEFHPERNRDLLNELEILYSNLAEKKNLIRNINIS
ncbi:mannitol-1-phosphate 5-dehydrogenase [Tangfeifania diversioriginum]|uniref:Mannitol-1-phosphate 5-dehydrogenase n=1 Tax=Tangfeifania diversioriginum TaxID=1168035 RepID=A0A1M6E2I4_9BACT|nr:NAD-binding protein [Tangfeifania diversioriginum]SHI79754.1 mannitol-1-phosphate 5-dehydrogenase [Tangfeifania diversioriginum]